MKKKWLLGIFTFVFICLLSSCKSTNLSKNELWNQYEKNTDLYSNTIVLMMEQPDNKMTDDDFIKEFKKVLIDLKASKKVLDGNSSNEKLTNDILKYNKTITKLFKTGVSKGVSSMDSETSTKIGKQAGEISSKYFSDKLPKSAERLIDKTSASSEDYEASSSETTSISESAKQNLGTRSNPIPFNSPMMLTGEFTDNDANQDFTASIKVEILSSTRGDAAWQQIIAENQFNEAAPAGKEYIINRVKITMSDASSNDLKTSFSIYDFNYISGSGSSYSNQSVVLPDALDNEIYNNGTIEGNVSGLIGVGDSPLLRLSDKFFFKTE